MDGNNVRHCFRPLRSTSKFVGVWIKFTHGCNNFFVLFHTVAIAVTSITLFDFKRSMTTEDDSIYDCRTPIRDTLTKTPM